jgi:hypothetical protein
MLGPRWSATPNGRWNPYIQLLAGGRTLTHELINPAKKAQVAATLAEEGKHLGFENHSLYTTQSQSTGFAFSVSAGVDLKLTNALALRALDLGYTWTGNATLDGVSYSHAGQISTGLVLRMGTW